MRSRNKLRSRKGETLSETLVAVLLVGLASVVLASMIGAASRMSARSLERDVKLYAAVTAAETKPDDSAETEKTDSKVRVNVGNAPAKEFTVTFFSDEDGTLYSYRYKKGGAP